MPQKPNHLFLTLFFEKTPFIGPDFPSFGNRKKQFILSVKYFIRSQSDFFKRLLINGFYSSDRA